MVDTVSIINLNEYKIGQIVYCDDLMWALAAAIKLLNYDLIYLTNTK